MKMAFLVAGVSGAAALTVVGAVVAAQQNREPDRGPVSRIAAALDADRDGSISAAEIRASSAALKTLDTNGDGRLAADELRPAFGPGGPREGGPGRRGRGDDEGRGGASAASPDELTDTLMTFDRNGDARLERGEVPERFQGLFDRADGNKDGLLTRDELKQSAAASAQADAGGGRGRGGRDGGGFGRGPGGPMADPLLRALDTDRDGAISEVEIAGAARGLASLDANSDGQLSSEEFRPPPFGGRDGRAGGGR
jgi:Ca2+-binding EF-hand superfamily protein